MNNVRIVVSGSDGIALVDTNNGDISFYADHKNTKLVHESMSTRFVVRQAQESPTIQWYVEKKFSNTTCRNELYVACRLGETSEEAIGVIRVSAPSLF
jgi:hypothetical protein